MSSNPTRKLSGTAAELLVASKLIARGFSVSWPVGEADRYDLISDSHSGEGKISRIQVKSTGKKLRGTFHVTFGCKGSTGQRRLYTKDEIDYFIVVISAYPNGPGFYIIPVGKIKAKVSNFWAPGEHPYGTERWRVCPFEEYRDRWDLLR